MEFNCITDCSQCCIERDYYPTKNFGKIGVLILPDEKKRIVNLAKKNNLKIAIFPRIGTSKGEKQPIKILAYQLMGKDQNGNTCPFLDIENEIRSPHGGYLCKIYDQRPLACKAYPLIESEPITLDKKCKFCKEHKSADQNLNSELESIAKIKNKMNGVDNYVWRFATGVGEESDKDQIQKGWKLEV